MLLERLGLRPGLDNQNHTRKGVWIMNAATAEHHLLYVAYTGARDYLLVTSGGPAPHRNSWMI